MFDLSSATIHGWNFIRCPSPDLLPVAVSPPLSPTPTLYPSPSTSPLHWPIPLRSLPPQPRPSKRDVAIEREIALAFTHDRHTHTHQREDHLLTPPPLTAASLSICEVDEVEAVKETAEDDEFWRRYNEGQRAVDEDDEGHFGELEGGAGVNDGEWEEAANEACDEDYRPVRLPTQRRLPRRKPRSRERRRLVTFAVSPSPPPRVERIRPAILPCPAIVVAVSIPSSALAVTSNPALPITVELPSSSPSSLASADGGRQQGRRLLLDQSVRQREERRREEKAVMEGWDIVDEDLLPFQPLPSSSPLTSSTASSYSTRSQPSPRPPPSPQLSGERCSGAESAPFAEEERGRRRRKKRKPQWKGSHQRGDRFAPLTIDRPHSTSPSIHSNRATSKPQQRRQPRPFPTSHSDSSEDFEDPRLPSERRAAKTTRRQTPPRVDARPSPPSPPRDAAVHSSSHTAASPDLHRMFALEAAVSAAVGVDAPRGSHPVRILQRKGARYRVEWSEPKGAPEWTWESVRRFESRADYAPLVERWREEEEEGKKRGKDEEEDEDGDDSDALIPLSRWLHHSSRRRAGGVLRMTGR